MAQIQWFPGHMAKARREITEKLKLVDIVLEILDARVPISSRNPMMGEILKDKPTLVLLNKANLSENDIDKVFVAGNLGKYCQIYDMINTQILPYAFRDKCVKLGSYALKGV